MESYIRQYPNVLDRELCQTLIEKFEECEDNHLSTMQSKNRQFTEVPLMENMGTFKDEFNVCLNSLHGAIEKYKEDLSIRSINSLNRPRANSSGSTHKRATRPSGSSGKRLR